MSNLQYLKSARGTQRSLVTRIYNECPNIENYDEVKINTLLAKLQRFQAELAISDAKIAEASFSASTLPAEIEQETITCEEYQDKIIEAQTRLNAALRQFAPTVTGGAAGAGASAARSLLKSPTAPLPVYYSGEDENLEQFLSNFEETVSKHKYTSYDKFLLLKQQVKGRALYLIDSLDPDRHTYDEARNLLMTALASRPIQVSNIIKQLSSLKLAYGSEPFKYMGEMRKITQAIDSLNITVDDIKQYFFLNGLNETFRAQLILVTNNSRPSLAEIMDKFYEANERYLHLQSAKKSKLEINSSNNKSVSSMAVNLPKVVPTSKSNPFDTCPLCCDSSHGIHRCQTYRTPSEKVKILQKLGLCTLCANPHLSDNCTWHFKNNCRHCNARHYSFLCLKLNPAGKVQTKIGVSKADCAAPKSNKKPGASSTEGNSSKIKVETKSNLVAAFSGQTKVDSYASVLGTFTCRDIAQRNLRGLWDCGSQSSFISEQCLSRLQYDVIDEVNLVVHGINGARDYQSKIICVDLNFGQNKKVNFFTLPSIDISLLLPGLCEVVADYSQKGYRLADQYLSNCGDIIGGLDLILGTDSAFCLDSKFVHYGQQSTYNDTQLGVILMGKVDQLRADMEYLPNHSSIETAAPVAALNSSSFACTNRAISYQNLVPTIFKQNSELLGPKLPDICNFSAEELDLECSSVLHESMAEEDGTIAEKDSELIDYIFKKTYRAEDGRLVVPLLWNDKVSHLLSQNFDLSSKILSSVIKKHGQNETHMNLMKQSMAELEDLGIIEAVNDENFISENPTCSFLAHMPIFRLGKESTKCRIVFLSNLSEKYRNGQAAVSHNQAMFSGPPLNSKLSTALISMRFNRFCLCWDLRKAFTNLGLSEADSNKLLFLWPKFNQDGSYTPVIYRNLRLTFGVRPAPCLLMCALYRILIMDTGNDSDRLRELKREIYHLTYMDNCSTTSENPSDLLWAYSQINSIFNAYKFEAQQFCTNCPVVDEKIKAAAQECETNCDESSAAQEQAGPPSGTVGLFGLQWHNLKDTLSANPIALNSGATTKREVLKTIAEVFDPFNFNCPLLNRARLFLHELQCSKTLGWDARLSDDMLRTWKNICNQLRNVPPIEIPRYVGDRKDSYRLVAFVDSSKDIYGTVLYIQCLRTKKVSFVLSKNRIVGKQLDSKTIPCLELNAVVLGAETMLELREELCGDSSVLPLNISELVLYSDSLVSLHWIQSYLNLDKMNKRSVFVKNRLDRLEKLCTKFPVTFKFVDGFANPADCVTRKVSFRQLQKTNYISGPEFLVRNEAKLSLDDSMCFTMPKATTDRSDCRSTVVLSATNCTHSLLDPEKFSSFRRLLGAYSCVLKFIRNLKKAVAMKSGRAPNPNLPDIRKDSLNMIIRCEQAKYFPEAFEYLSKPTGAAKDLPPILSQLNLFLDHAGLLRVGGKLFRKTFGEKYFPILIPKDSHVTKLLILDAHVKLRHGGIYAVLNSLRKLFWIPTCFSVVKRVLRQCTHCRRFNNRAIKLNQNSYMDIRLNPSETPYAHVFLDYLGFYYVMYQGVKTKVWILCVCCVYTRAINLHVALDMTTEEFLRLLQMHIYEWGLPVLTISDSGTNLVAGADVVSNFLNDSEVSQYLLDNNTSCVKFQQYFKGCPKLGSLVESCVKLTKRLLSASIKNNVLELRDFEFLVMEARHLVNRRIIALKETLRDPNSFELPEPITPESLLHGRHLLSVNIVPGLQPISEEEYRPNSNFTSSQSANDLYKKLRKVRHNLRKTYHEEYFVKLLSESVDRKDRYQPITHSPVAPGDLVLIKEEYSKPSSYPMGRVKSVVTNELDEVTGAHIMKGKTREVVKRHSDAIIPLLRMSECPSYNSLVVPTGGDGGGGASDPAGTGGVTCGHAEDETVRNPGACTVGRPPRRAAALQSEQRSRLALQV